jgi:starch-binding outer membrane protein, SusD/RagB family
VATIVCYHSACRKLVQTPSPGDEVSSNSVFSSYANAESALMGLYIQIMNNNRGPLNGDATLYGALSADELTIRLPDPLLDPFLLNSLNPTSFYCTELYTQSYTLLYTANSLVEGLGTGNLTDMAELRGEAEVIRALMYFYLVNFYGPVPLVTSINYDTTALLPRAPVAQVYAEIISDLRDACAHLSATYISSSAYPGARTRPNQAAARALLARVYLYQGEWAAAEQEADTVIANPLYRLETDLDSVFLATSAEAIWQLQPVYDSMATAEGYLFIPRNGARPTYTLTSWLQDSWEPGDQRRTYWTDSVGTGSMAAVYPYKYKYAYNDPPNAEYNMVLRLAEVYLIRAEAQAQQGNIAGAAADLNTIRARAGLPMTNASTQAGMLAAILHERQVELFSEWGHRWLDLRRMGQADAVLGLEKPGWTGTDTLYPIPGPQLANNPNLTQNAGY